MDFMVLLPFVAPLLAIGGAYGGAKVALNGSRERIKLLEAEGKENSQRLVRVETKLDLLLSQKILEQ